MTANERTLQSIERELEKLYKSKERLEKLLEKKTAAAEKVGMNITDVEWFKIRDDEITGKQYAAYFDMSCTRGELDDILNRIAKKITMKEKTESAEKEISRQRKAEEIEKARAKVIEEWTKDGITVEHMRSNSIYGKTPSGKNFVIYGNNGTTERSLHCFTLTIDGETIFTSGEFYRAYKMVKNN